MVVPGVQVDERMPWPKQRLGSCMETEALFSYALRLQFENVLPIQYPPEAARVPAYMITASNTRGRLHHVRFSFDPATVLQMEAAAGM
jgi:hypothetical protein